MKIIPYQKQSIDEEDIKAITEASKSELITTGPKVKEFEEAFSKSVGSKYSVAVSHGTAALHVAYLAAGLKEGDEVILPPLTFLGDANSVLYCKAKPVFVDVDSQMLLDSEKIKDKLTEKTKLIVPTHLGGLTCDVKKLREIFKGIIIEDACHALGASFEGEKIGNCKYSDMAVFSLHPLKHITTGEGGMITTNSEFLYKKLLLFRTHGIDSSKRTEQEPWATPMTHLGFNYRITDIQCALGLSQLAKLDKFVNASRNLASKYHQIFENNHNVTTLKENENQFNSYHLFPILVKDKNTRLKLFNFLRENGIFAQVHYQPIYQQPYYQNHGFMDISCPKAENFYNRMLSIPIYPQLTEVDQKYVIDTINDFFENS